MKKISFLLFSLLIYSSAISQNANISFRFSKNGPDSVFCNLGDGSIKFKSDSNKFYYAEINTEKPQFVEIIFNAKYNKYFNLYLFPGDSLSFDLYNANFIKLNFNKNSKSYFYNLLLSDIQNLTTTYSISKNQLNTLEIPGLNAFVDGADKALNSTFNHYVQEYKIDDSYFLNTINNQIQYLINSLKLYPLFSPFTVEEQLQFFNTLKVDNEEYLIFKNYREYVESYILTDYALRNEDYMKEYDMDDELAYYKVMLELSDKLIANQKIKNNICSDFISKNLKYIFLIPGIDEIITLYESICTDSKEKDKMKSYLAELRERNLTADNKLLRYEFEDLKGNKINLDKYKGKYVYLDFWAPWCTPCVEEIPHLKKLIEEYKNKDIIFVSVCVWDKKENWLNFFINNSNTNGEQLYGGSNKDLTNPLNIFGIPHFILLDKSGKIVSANFLRPSDENINDKLDDILKK